MDRKSVKHAKGLVAGSEQQERKRVDLLFSEHSRLQLAKRRKKSDAGRDDEWQTKCADTLTYCSNWESFH